jgi:hypothetical protein
MVVHHSTATLSPERIGIPKRTRTSACVAVACAQ